MIPACTELSRSTGRSRRAGLPAPIVPRQQVGLTASPSGGLWPDLPRLGEAAADTRFEDLGFGAVEELDESQTAGPQELCNRHLDSPEKRFLPRPVTSAYACDLGRSIAEQDVGAVPQVLQKWRKDGGIREISLHCEHVLELERRIDRREIHPRDPPARAHALRRYLEPSARPAAEVDHALTSPEDPLGPLDLQQLVGRPRGVSLALGALVEGILALIGQEVYPRAATALRTRTRPLLCPGTAPRTISRFRSASTLTTSRLRTVTRTLPIRPNMPMPLMTFPG